MLLGFEIFSERLYSIIHGPSWSWWYGSWIYNYLCNQCLSPLTLWVWTLLRRGVLDTVLCDKVYQWLATDRWFSLCTPVSFTNKTYSHNITETLLKVSLNTITQPNHSSPIIHIVDTITNMLTVLLGITFSHIATFNQACLVCPSMGALK